MAAVPENELRKRSVGVVELTDSSGRRKTVALETLSDADRELAAKFGYKPVSVSTCPKAPILIPNHRSSNESSVISRPSPSPSASVVSTRPLPLHLCSPFTLADLPLLYGVG